MPNSQINIFTDYIPAQVKTGKICRIVYYAKNPTTLQLERLVIKCNRLATKKENYRLAVRIADEINDKLRDGFNPFVEKMSAAGYKTFAEVLPMFWQAKTRELRPDSLRCYRSYLQFFERHLESVQMRGSFVFTFGNKQARLLLSQLEANGVSNKTYNGYLAFFIALFNWFVDRDFCKENPFGKIKKKKVETKYRTTIPPEVRAQIKDYLFGSGASTFYYVMLLCYRCLIRPKEILMLKIGNIDYENRLLQIPANVAKNHNERLVALPCEIYDYLCTLKDCPAHNYIFSDNYLPGTVMKNSRDIGRTWQHLRAVLGFPDCYTFYSLKDTGITEMLENGVPAKLVKELADHSSLEMTEKYTHKSAANKILEYENSINF